MANASAVNLATAAPFAVLGGSGVTNTGPSVLNGDLGVAPGTSLTGFTFPAVVNGPTHDDDAVAVQAQRDLSTAYNTAAAQPVAPADVLTGQDLGGKTLTPGAYSFSSSAQLTGQVTLDAQGDPNAQFVFEVGSTLTTASSSSVVLINGASPCNVYWQIGSSATVGSATAFQGNLMASTSITLNTGATVQGRVLASTGAVTLDDNTINDSTCATSSPTPTPTPSPTPPKTSAPTTTPAPAGTSKPTTTPATPSTSSKPTSPSTSRPKPKSPAPAGKPAVHHSAPTHQRHTASNATGTARLAHSRGATRPGSAGFTASVNGREIKSVRFTINGRLIGTRTRAPFRIHVPGDFSGRGVLEAHVTFKDSTHARTLTMSFQSPAPAVVHPLPAPSTFTG